MSNPILEGIMAGAGLAQKSANARQRRYEFNVGADQFNRKLGENKRQFNTMMDYREDALDQADIHHQARMTEQKAGRTQADRHFNNQAKYIDRVYNDKQALLKHQRTARQLMATIQNLTDNPESVSAGDIASAVNSQPEELRTLVADGIVKDDPNTPRDEAADINGTGTKHNNAAATKDNRIVIGGTGADGKVSLQTPVQSADDPAAKTNSGVPASMGRMEATVAMLRQLNAIVPDEEVTAFLEMRDKHNAVDKLEDTKTQDLMRRRESLASTMSAYKPAEETPPKETTTTEKTTPTAEEVPNGDVWPPTPEGSDAGRIEELEKKIVTLKWDESQATNQNAKYQIRRRREPMEQEIKERKARLDGQKVEKVPATVPHGKSGEEVKDYTTPKKTGLNGKQRYQDMTPEKFKELPISEQEQAYGELAKVMASLDKDIGLSKAEFKRNQNNLKQSLIIHGKVSPNEAASILHTGTADEQVHMQDSLYRYTRQLAANQRQNTTYAKLDRDIVKAADKHLDYYKSAKGPNGKPDMGSQAYYKAFHGSGLRDTAGYNSAVVAKLEKPYKDLYWLSRNNGGYKEPVLHEAMGYNALQASGVIGDDPEYNEVVRLNKALFDSYGVWNDKRPGSALGISGFYEVQGQKIKEHLDSGGDINSFFHQFGVKIER